MIAILMLVFILLLIALFLVFVFLQKRYTISENDTILSDADIEELKKKVKKIK